MRIKYIFIDESGDLGQHGSKYFIVAAIVFNDDKMPKRINLILEKEYLIRNRNLPMN